MVRYIDDIFPIGTKECATVVTETYNGSGLTLCSAEHNVFLDLNITLYKYYENYAVPLYTLYQAHGIIVLCSLCIQRTR